RCRFPPPRQDARPSRCRSAARRSGWRIAAPTRRGSVRTGSLILQRNGSARATGSEQRWLGPDLVGVRAVCDHVDDAVLLEVHGELRIDPAVDGGPMGLLAATRIKPLRWRAEACLDLAHGLPAHRY